jgi:hypothetical protein
MYMTPDDVDELLRRELRARGMRTDGDLLVLSERCAEIADLAPSRAGGRWANPPAVAGQRRSASAVEAVTNTTVGLIGSFIITFVMLHLIEDRAVAAAATVAGCTLWSLARGYAIRRLFDAAAVREAQQF